MPITTFRMFYPKIFPTMKVSIFKWSPSNKVHLQIEDRFVFVLKKNSFCFQESDGANNESLIMVVFQSSLFWVVQLMFPLLNITSNQWMHLNHPKSHEFLAFAVANHVVKNFINHGRKKAKEK